MEKIIELTQQFEKRNNLSVTVCIHTDYSGNVEEFWDGEKLFSFNDLTELKYKLKSINYKKNSEGICLSPVQIDN